MNIGRFRSGVSKRVLPSPSFGSTIMSERRLLDSFTAPKDVLDEFAQMADEDDVDPFAETAKERQIAARQGEYHARRFERQGIAGTDAFKDAAEGRETEGGYKDAMALANLEREEQRVLRVIAEREKQAREDGTERELDRTPPREELEEAMREVQATAAANTKRKRRWDDDGAPKAEPEPTPAPAAAADEAPKKRRSRWDATPADVAAGTSDAPKRSRWDQVSDAAPTGLAPIFMSAPGLNADDKNVRYLSDEELDTMLPPTGYAIVTPPPGYAPAMAPARKLGATPLTASGGFHIQDPSEASDSAAAAAQLAPELPTEIPGVGALAFFKAEDAKYFEKILKEEDETELTVEEMKERKIMRLLLKIKNGTPPVRKTALRQITDKAREFGAGPLFDKILPLLMERTLEDQERHLLVKVIDRVLYKLDDLVRPYVHKILVVIEPLLIDEDYYARVEGREIISNLSKAAGLAHMISTMRPDIDHADEYVRNTTARAFSVVASALGIPSLLPFLKAVCRSKKSWQARHTGVRIVQQIAIMMGCAVLPHLRNLVDTIAHGLEDDQQKVRTMTALGLAALAEASAPYGIEAFDNVLEPLWKGIRMHRGKGLAAFLKAIGFIIPLMETEHVGYYVKEVTIILIREFQSSDEEMKKIVLKVVKQCAATEGVTPGYIKSDILPDFFKSFWIRRMALDRRNYRQVVETTVELAQKAGVAEIVGRIVDGLKVCPTCSCCGTVTDRVCRTTQSRTARWSWRRLRMSFRPSVPLTSMNGSKPVWLMALSTRSRSRRPKIRSCWTASVLSSTPLVRLSGPSPYFADQTPRYPRQAVPHADRLDRSLAAQQQECKGSPTSGRSYNALRGCHQAVWRGPTAGKAWCCSVRTAW